MTSAGSSDTKMSNSPPKLDSSTRNLLDDFLFQKKKEKALFEHLKSRSSSASTANTRTRDGSSSNSSASSITSKTRGKDKRIDPGSRNILNLLPRGRAGKGVNSEEQEEEEEDEDSLIAQAEALADLERLNGVEPSIPISTLRVEESDTDNDSDEDEGHDSNAPDERQPHQMDVDEFRRYFGESWQLSQFWYSSEFSYHLAHCLHDLLKLEPSSGAPPDPQTKKVETLPDDFEPGVKIKKIGFICCPTSYVAFRYLYSEMLSQLDEIEYEMAIESYLFDYDERFSLVTPRQYDLPNPGTAERFVHYDLNKPLTFPSSLENQLDMVIIDPPYLKVETNQNIAQTVKKLLKSKEGKVLLITGQSIAEQACEIYGNEKIGPLRRAEKIEVEHVGLKNDFGAWGNWAGVEMFGMSREYTRGRTP